MVKRVLIIGLLITFFLIGACSEDPMGGTEILMGDIGFNLFENGEVVDIEPGQFVQGFPLQFKMMYNCRYEGKGTVFMYGRGGGQPIGDMVSPILGEIGVLVFEVSIHSGENLIPISLIPTTDHSALGFGITVICDSLLVEGEMVLWNSPEGVEFFKDDLLPDTAFFHNSIGEIVTLYRAES